MKIVNTYNRPIPKLDGDGYKNISLTAVLTVGECNDYVVYIAIGTPEFAMNHGVKLCFKEALHYFPAIEKNQYRR